MLMSSGFAESLETIMGAEALSVYTRWTLYLSNRLPFEYNQSFAKLIDHAVRGRRE
jgi:hypothetical protein